MTDRLNVCDGLKIPVSYSEIRINVVRCGGEKNEAEWEIESGKCKIEDTSA